MSTTKSVKFLYIFENKLISLLTGLTELSYKVHKCHGSHSKLSRDSEYCSTRIIVQSLDKRVAGQVPLGDDLFTFTPSKGLLSSLQDVYAREKKLYAKENDKVCDKSNPTVQCTLDSEQCTLESEECTLESEQCTVESEQCTLEGEKLTLECEQSTTGLGSSWEKISSLIAQFGIRKPVKN